jgi:hypothetical protein
MNVSNSRKDEGVPTLRRMKVSHSRKDEGVPTAGSSRIKVSKSGLWCVDSTAVSIKIVEHKKSMRIPVSKMKMKASNQGMKLLELMKHLWIRHESSLWACGLVIVKDEDEDEGVQAWR